MFTLHTAKCIDHSDHGPGKTIGEKCASNNKIIHPCKQTWNLKIPPWKRKHIYKPPIFGFHVCFRGCNDQQAMSDRLVASTRRCNFASKTIRFHSNWIISSLFSISIGTCSSFFEPPTPFVAKNHMGHLGHVGTRNLPKTRGCFHPFCRDSSPTDSNRGIFHFKCWTVGPSAQYSSSIQRESEKT